ncbi:hypothetical protein [Mycoplasmopsis gallopavonis]|uniref:hypothetical protein n=1 Tax=Mycoplasmopsis gallopavonis TaxID=76629 RepID=UPI00101BAB10|nr:hypothetical protein [Mycoplasmopsis gallopavonis]
MTLIKPWTGLKSQKAQKSQIKIIKFKTKPIKTSTNSNWLSLFGNEELKLIKPKIEFVSVKIESHESKTKNHKKCL